MNCSHPRPHEELPCAWPGCPEGTPQQTVVLLQGDAGAVTARHGASLRIESDGGVQMWRRKPSGAGWEWEPAKA